MATHSATTVSRLFLDRVAETPDGTAYLAPQAAGGWKSYTWQEVGVRVRALASGLRALGVKPEQRVSILAGTRVEWIFADLAIMCAGAATTTIYPTSTVEDTAYILENSESVVCIAENEAQAAKVRSQKASLPALQKVVVIDGKGSDDGFVLSFEQLAEQGAAFDRANPGAFEAAANAPGPQSLATLIYTSGTTGKPKGVMLTHDCWVYEGEGIDGIKLLGKDDVQYLWLPLAHSFGKVLEVAQLRIGFATAVDGRVDKLIENLAEIKPTFVAAVPRIFEKVHNKVVGGVIEAGGMKKKIFDWAFGVGREVSRLQQQGKEPGGFLAMKRAIAHKLVFTKLHARFGGRLRFFISGSAPLNRDLAEFFHAAGLFIAEGYGLTETSAASFVNRPEAYKFGSVGLPLGGTQLKLAEADGEILIRGRGVMKGYYKLDAETAETLDADGWLHTGDIGEVDAKGLLRITDRKKDLIKTSGGKYVAPQSIEGKMKTISGVVSQMVVHGNNRNFCSALISLDEEAIRKWAGEHGKAALSYAELSTDVEVKALVQGHVDQLNKELAKYETIKKFALLPADLTLESGELTPSLKLKRKVVEAKYKAVLDGFYQGSAGGAD